MANDLGPGHSRLVLARPPKPPAEMTDDELDAWVVQLYNSLALQHKGPQNKTVVDGKT